MRSHVSAALKRVADGEEARFVVPIVGARRGDRKPGAPARAEKRARRRWRILAVLALLLAVACHHGPKVRDGFVAGKSHSEAYCSTYYILVGKVLVPEVTCYPEHWNVTLRACHERQGKSGEECHSSDWDVGESRWREAEQGDHLVIR